MAGSDGGARRSGTPEKRPLMRLQSRAQTPPKAERTASLVVAAEPAAAAAQLRVLPPEGLPEIEPEPEPEPGTGTEPEPDLERTSVTGMGKGLSDRAVSRARATFMSKIAKEWAIEHGYLEFTSGQRKIRDDSATCFTYSHQGKFLKISGTADLSRPFVSLANASDRQTRVQQLLSVLTIMEKEWQMAIPPPMVISVTGDAAPVTLGRKYSDIFESALLMATESTGAWVTTGGADTGVMKLVGDSMTASSTPVVGCLPWGVLKGRYPLRRPSQALVAERIRAQIVERNERVPAADEPVDCGTDDRVVQHYMQHKNAGWADPASPPADLGERLTFILPSHPAGMTLKQAGLISNTRASPRTGLMSGEGRPNLSKRFPELRTGKLGRGELGRWGPNHTIETIVTRRSPQTTDSDKSGLQVALVFRERERCWSIPSTFASRQKEDTPVSVEDQARQAVCQMFERGDGKGHAEDDEASDLVLRREELFDDLFKKTDLALVYRGLSDDPRNSKWHASQPISLPTAHYTACATLTS